MQTGYDTIWRAGPCEARRWFERRNDAIRFAIHRPQGRVVYLVTNKEVWPARERKAKEEAQK